MSYWNSRGLRGNTFEEMINITNEVYKTKNLAIIQKIPTSIVPIKINKETRQITLAYFEKKSTVDYMGVVKGIPICFDAKEVTRKYLPLQNIHEHQIEFMNNFQKQGGISFLLVNFVIYNECFYLPFDNLKKSWEESKKCGRKSIPYNDFNKKLIVRGKNNCYFHYLESLKKFLEMQNSKGEII